MGAPLEVTWREGVGKGRLATVETSTSTRGRKRQPVEG